MSSSVSVSSNSFTTAGVLVGRVDLGRLLRVDVVDTALAAVAVVVFLVDRGTESLAVVVAFIVFIFDICATAITAVAVDACVLLVVLFDVVVVVVVVVAAGCCGSMFVCMKFSLGTVCCVGRQT